MFYSDVGEEAITQSLLCPSDPTSALPILRKGTAVSTHVWESKLRSPSLSSIRKKHTKKSGRKTTATLQSVHAPRPN